MIKLEHTVLPSPEQMEFIIEGIRNPMNSWGKSDSSCGKVTKDTNVQWSDDYFLGTNDADLMLRLAKAGRAHRKYMRMMPVFVRITAPLYWWKEFDTYKVGTVANSCSTMHKIQEKEFTLEDFSCERLINDSVFSYPLGGGWRGLSPIDNIKSIIYLLNNARTYFLEMERKLKEDKLTDNEREEITQLKKQYWWQMIQLLPSSYNQTRNVMLNYEALANIYWDRKNHKLDEWHVFCDWIEALPYFELIKNTKPSMKEKIKAVFDKLISMAKDKERFTHYDTEDIPGWLEEVWEEEFENMEE